MIQRPTVVVVGDGPSPEGMRWGEAIDRADAVVRLYNHQWQRMEDYGTRYDHGLITSKGDPFRAWRKPALSWFFYNGAGQKLLQPMICERSVVEIDWVKWLNRALAMGAIPHAKTLKLTRGFVAAAGALDQLKPGRVILIGMDMLRSGETMSPRYAMAAAAWRDEVYPGVPLEAVLAGSPREGPHDYPVESELFATLAAEAGTEIAWGY